MNEIAIPEQALRDRRLATRCGTDNSRKFPRGAAKCGGRGLGGVKLRMYRGAAYANENKWRNWAHTHSHTANTEHGRTAGTATHAAVVPRLSKNAVWAYECCQISSVKINISKKRCENFSWKKKSQCGCQKFMTSSISSCFSDNGGDISYENLGFSHYLPAFFGKSRNERKKLYLIGFFKVWSVRTEKIKS